MGAVGSKSMALLWLGPHQGGSLLSGLPSAVPLGGTTTGELCGGHHHHLSHSFYFTESFQARSDMTCVSCTGVTIQLFFAMYYITIVRGTPHLSECNFMSDYY